MHMQTLGYRGKMCLKYVIRYNILITFPKFKKNKIALAIKNFHELFQLILGYTMCKVCMVRFHGCLI